VVLFHGLEGGSGSHYASALIARRGTPPLARVRCPFRGLRGEPNRLPRAYHSGVPTRSLWILPALRGLDSGDADVLLPAVSLGACVAEMAWTGERASARESSMPRRPCPATVDLMTAGDRLGNGLNRAIRPAFSCKR